MQPALSYLSCAFLTKARCYYLWMSSCLHVTYFPKHENYEPVRFA